MSSMEVDAREDTEAPCKDAGSKYDEFLGDNLTAKDVPIPRASTSYTCYNEKYKLPDQRMYSRQYAQVYFARLLTLRPVLLDLISERWPGVPVVNILEVGENCEVAVVGTLYKDMKLRPTVLDEYAKDRGLQAALSGTNFCSDTDSLILEDEGARMALSGDVGVLPVHELVTGVVMAVRGSTDGSGVFKVTDVCFPGLAPQPPLPSIQDDQYVAVLSGLVLSSKKTDTMQLQLAIDFLTGALGSRSDQALAGRIVRVVIAGNSIGGVDSIATVAPYTRQQTVELAPIKDMDMYLTELATAMPVDLMPGPEDPANLAMPQQPLHRCMFPGASKYGSLTRVHNPHEFEVGGVRFLGTAGQNVDDLCKYAQRDSRLHVLGSFLQWRNIAPTAPDTLASYPFVDKDPFILHECPHVLFAANQREFGTTVVEGDAGQQVRIISVPRFNTTGTVVLINLRTLQCQKVSFSSSMEVEQ